jgi:hypothetical protein
MGIVRRELQTERTVMSLTGETSGQTRAELIAVAEELASTYFGTGLVCTPTRMPSRSGGQGARRRTG